MNRSSLSRALLYGTGAATFFAASLRWSPAFVEAKSGATNAAVPNVGGVCISRNSSRNPQTGAEGAMDSRITRAYGRLPLTFEENQGQVNPQVRFLSRGRGYKLFLTSNGAAISFGRFNADSIRLRLGGANRWARAEGLEQVQTKSNYLVGNDPRKWHMNVPQFARVKYAGIYPRIDLVYYGSTADNAQLEFDYLIAPGANPGDIRLVLDGPVRMDADGSLLIGAGEKSIRLQKPVAYQEEKSEDRRQGSGVCQKDAARHSSRVSRHLVAGRYILRRSGHRLRGNGHACEVSLNIGAYDHSKPLVIDPLLTYSTYLGGTNLDYAYGIAVDSAGSAYVTGMTDSLDFPAAGSIQGPGGGTCSDDLNFSYNCFDAFVAKLNPTGTALVYSTFLGGSNNDRGTAIAVDSVGNVYIAGSTISNDFPTANAFQSSFGGGNCGTANTPCYDAFVAKLNPSGSALLYSTYLGGIGNDIAAGISVDSAGAAYLTGATTSTNFPVTASSFQLSYGGGTYNAFVTKLNPAGSSLAYSTYLGGSGEDHGAAIAVDSSGNAFVAGYTISTNFPTKAALQPSFSGGTCGTTPCFDAFVSKLNPTGSALAYSTYIGGTGGDYGYGIVLDSSGDAFVTGMTTSTDFPVTPGAFQPTGGGTNYNAYVMKLNPAGSALVFSTYFGGIGTEVASAIALDSSGNAYIAGYAYGQGMPLASPLQAVCGYQDDAFVAKVNSTASTVIFSTYLGGNGNDVSQGISVDSSGNLYVAGGTYSTDFPVTSGALMTAFGGGAYNAFVAKISSIKLPVSTLSQSSILFASQGVGTTSQPTMVSLKNNGDAMLSISSIRATGDFAVTNNCGATVSPGASCALSITFTPTDYGQRTGTVTVTDNAWGSPRVINVTGGGINSVTVSLAPSSLAFGSQLPGTTSASQAIMLSNNASIPLNVTAVSIGPGFSQTNTCPAAMAGGTSCSIQVVFSPTIVAPYSAQLTITDDAPSGNPNQVALSGTGNGPAVSLSTASLAFGDQYMSTTSPQQTVIVTNTGTASLTFTNITSSANFVQTNNCSGAVKVGSNCSINVNFTPTMSSTVTGKLTLSDNAFPSPQIVNLSGNGLIPPRQTFGVPLASGRGHGKHKGKK